MFSKILIANRGEIACRVIKTARRLGVRTVAVYSEADAGARHVRLADEAVLIGPPPARESYLRDRRDPRRPPSETGAEAIHPGYGFLSENEDFAAACAAGGRRVHRAARRGDPRHGLQVRVEAADGEGRRPARAGLSRRRPGPGVPESRRPTRSAIRC